MAKSAMTKSGKGGGPQTEEGKKVTSRNALKTGAYSNTLILPGEDESDFRQIEEQFVRDFDPRDMAEIAMVRDLAVLAWKKIRLENVELRVTLHRLNQPPDYHEKREARYLSMDLVKEHLEDLSTYTPSYRKSLELALSHLKKLQSREVVAKDLVELESEFPVLFKILLEQIQSFEIKNSTAEKVAHYRFVDDEGDEQSFVAYFLVEATRQVRELVWLIDHRAQIEAELQAMRDKRLMVLMENPTSSRAFDDLRRNFYRTLGELRKHQVWRRKLQGIDAMSAAQTVDEGDPE